MTFFRQSLLLLAGVLIGTGVTALTTPRPPLVAGDEINATDAAGRQNILWVDARPEPEFTRDHIAGAVNLNEDNWSQAITGVLEIWIPGQTVIVYCSSTACTASHTVAGRLRSPEYNLENVLVLHGGWEAWMKQGAEVSRD